MSVVPCRKNAALRAEIERFAEALREQAHTLGDHGLDAQAFHDSGLFRGAIERLRGQFAASMGEKRGFAAAALDAMLFGGFIRDWESAGEANRHDYTVTLKDGGIAAIELKGCLDGNNTNIFERPPQAREFVIWSVCTNPGADPQHNVWSGVHTRLSAEIVARGQRVDGLVVWDMMCGTLGRPCPKLAADPSRATPFGRHNAPPPCLYLFPATIPSPRNNPKPPPQKLGEVKFLQAMADCFGVRADEAAQVEIAVAHDGPELVRTTRIIAEGETQRMSEPTAIRRA